MSNRGVLLASALALLSACQDVTPPEQRNVTGATAQLEPAAVRSLAPDDFAEQFALANPGYAGLRLSEDRQRVEVLVTDLERSEAIVRALRPVLDMIPLGPAKRLGDLPVVTRSVRYGFDQLQPWRRLARERGEAFGVSRLHIDEGRNLLVIGVTNETNVSAVRESLTNAGVPADAIEVNIRPPFMPSTTDTINTFANNNIVRPGFTARQLGGPGSCTMGPFVGDISGTPHFVTNGHCTKSWGSVATGDSAKFFQPYYNALGGSMTLGVEVADAAPFSCAGHAQCRYSDAVYVRYTDSLDAIIGFLPPYEMSRLTQRTTGIGSLATDLGETIAVTCQASPVTNMGVEKVGATSGWTYGSIIDDDVDGILGTDIGDVWLMDQVEYSAYTAGGDSGSAVFQTNDSWVQNPWSGEIDVCLMGVNHSGSGSDGFFSPIAGVEADNGPISVF